MSDLLRFSRCSHRLHTLADHPFAWRNLPLDLSPMVNIINAKLLRHRPCSLSVSYDPPQILTVLDAMRVEPWGRIEQMHWGANMFAHGSQQRGLLRIVTHASMKELRVLRFNTHSHGGHADADDNAGEKIVQLFSAINSLAHLHTIDMENWSEEACSIGLKLLADAPSLTSLSFEDNPSTWNRPSPSLEHAANLPLLTHLSVSAPAFGIAGGASSSSSSGSGPVSPFLRFCTSPLMMSNLTSLRVDHFICGGLAAVEGEAAVLSGFNCKRSLPVPANDFIEGMRALRSLHTLHLSRVMEIDTWISALTHSPSLRSLIVQPDVLRDDSIPPSFFPSPAVLRSALERMPQLVEYIVLLPKAYNTKQNICTVVADTTEILQAGDNRIKIKTL